MTKQTSSPTVTILGTGYVGLTTAAIFAAAGIKTYVVDPNDSRLEAVRQGRSFFYEEGLDPLVEHGIKTGLLIPTGSYKNSVPKSDIVISAVGTPDNPDGSSNLTYIFAAAEEAATYLKPGAIYAQKSTVPVGTGARIKELFAEKKIKTPYLSNPEFLRESTALFDSLWFDRIVVGGSDAEAIEKLMVAYRLIQQARDKIAAISGLDSPEVLPSEQYVSTSLENAEMIKVTSNSFLALKISFANSIAKLADKAGADVKEIMDIVGADRRIGRAFLNAGRGYGGGCFPKDVMGLISSAAAHGVEMPIMNAAKEVNDSMPGYVINKTKEMLGSLQGKNIAVLGLAFKAGTSDVRCSSGIEIANILVKNEAKVKAYDPKANDEAKNDLNSSVKLAVSLEKAVQGADAVIIATEWPEFIDYNLEKLAKTMSGKFVVDGMNCLDQEKVKNAGLQYDGVGRR